MRRTLLAVATTAALILALAPAASAEEVDCTGALGPATYDNIRVPDGATCTLDGTRAEGSVVVGTGATLTARGVTVIGNVQAEGAADVSLTGSTVGGSVQLKQGGTHTVRDTDVTADIQFESNDGPVSADANQVGGNVQIIQNTGGATVTGNTIDGNLQCKENVPAPTGGGNVVQGSAEDQCAALTADGPAPTPDPTPAPTPAPSPTDPAPSPSPSTPPGDDDDDDGGDDDGTPARSTSRLAGPDRFTTSVAIAQEAFPDGAPVVYLARADDFPDSLAGGVLTRGPILLVPSCGALPDVIGAEIVRLGATQVVALGGTAAICDDILEAAAAA